MLGEGIAECSQGSKEVTIQDTCHTDSQWRSTILTYGGRGGRVHRAASNAAMMLSNKRGPLGFGLSLVAWG